MDMDLTSALARLLSDASLRAERLRDPDRLAERLEIRPDVRDAFRSLDEEMLERQAAAIISKRHHEVAMIVPETMRRLGTSSRSVFSAYAQQRWPHGHRRHREDATAFCEYLETHRYSDVCEHEFQLLRFESSGKRLRLRFARVLPDGTPVSYALLLFYRSSCGGARWRAWFLRRPH